MAKYLYITDESAYLLQQLGLLASVCIYIGSLVFVDEGYLIMYPYLLLRAGVLLYQIMGSRFCELRCLLVARKTKFATQSADCEVRGVK